MMQLQTLFTFFAALFGGLLTMQLTIQIQRANVGNAKGLADYAGQTSTPTFVEKLGLAFLRLSHLDLTGWNQRLRWAQLGGHTQTQTLAHFFGLSLVYALGGVIVALMTRAPVMWAGAVILTLMPMMRLRSQADTTRRHVRRALPEMAALIAAEMAANNPPELALLRAAELPGPLAAIVREAVQNAQRTGRPLFSRKPVAGVLTEAVAAWDLPALNTFARQLDLAGAEQMNRTARGLTREYREELLRRSERLESNLLVPSMVFVFLPLLIVVLVTVGLPVLRAF